MSDSDTCPRGHSKDVGYPCPECAKDVYSSTDQRIAEIKSEIESWNYADRESVLFLLAEIERLTALNKGIQRAHSNLSNQKYAEEYKPLIDQRNEFAARITKLEQSRSALRENCEFISKLHFELNFKKPCWCHICKALTADNQLMGEK